MLCMWVVYQLKLPSSFSESGLLAYDGPPDGNKGGKAEEMFLSPVYLQDKRYHRCFTHRKSERLVRRGNRKNKQTLSIWKTLGSDCGQCSIPAFHSLATFSQYPRAQRLSIREKFCRAFPSNCRFFQRNRRIPRTVLASVSSHDDDGNEKI